MNFRLGVCAFLLACFFASPILAQDHAKAHLLSEAEEKLWIEAFKNHPTMDGATALQVLQYAEKMRPTKFKFGSIDVGYGGDTGEPASVSVDYWIGAKRLEGDAYSDIGYDVERQGSSIKIVKPTSDELSHPTMTAFERGRTEFILYIDKMYAEECFDFKTKAKIC